MSVLSKLLVKSTTRVIKNTAKFELAVDDLIEKFNLSCPPKDQLLKIVEQKNQIQSALQNVLGEFSKVDKTVKTTETIVTTVEAAVRVIKAIPVPTSVPPGVGIPINVITLLADSLDTLGDLVKGAKGSLKIVPTVSKSVTESAQIILDKLTELDGKLNICIEELAEGMNDQEKSELLNEIGNVAAASGLSTNVNLNVANEEELVKRLQPGATDRFLYQKTGFPNPDWLLTIEYNNKNEFTFPQRRIRAENINKFDGNPYKGVVVYNIYGKKYSYSTSVEVLVDEVKFVIEQLDTNWYKNNNPEFNTSGQFNTQTQQIDRPSTGTPTAPREPIKFNMNPLFNNGKESKRINLPTNINGLNNILNGRVITTRPSQSIEINVDTGFNVGRLAGLDPFVKLKFTPDILKSINPSQNPDFRVRTLSVTDEREYTRKFTYNEPGEYTFKLEVVEQFDVLPTNNPELKAEAWVELFEND
jgi:hypothetical protein|tara:strand:- start:3391 stop:4809 length:1419 start_codon:yes stop_codon:yes gene_type:complete